MPPESPLPVNLASALNQGCYCHTLNRAQLAALLGKDPTLRTLAAQLAETHPHLFSDTVVFLSGAVYRGMVETIDALERTMALPGWTRHALQHAPAIAQIDHGPQGVFMGYDFHVAADGAKLIEINTNAGGALLNAALARAQDQCCREMEVPVQDYRQLADLERDFIAMFRQEWQLQRGDLPLRTLAIVDDDPEGQYLAPEFALFVALCAEHGLQARVVDAQSLEYRQGRLMHGSQPLDLVYNRVTDFMLAEPRHAALAQAYVEGAVVLTPHPRAHALRANKQHLVTLAQPEALAALGIAPADLATLQGAVPHAEQVTPAHAERLWKQRAGLFFKPFDGFGARAVYRGDKVTRKVWDHIVQGAYLAQSIVPPALRSMELAGARTALKFDVRAYTYRGRVLLLAARTYQGQATNFRTEGGGFAPVIVVPTPA